jgi:hypothetical protein
VTQATVWPALSSNDALLAAQAPAQIRLTPRAAAHESGTTSPPLPLTRYDNTRRKTMADHMNNEARMVSQNPDAIDETHRLIASDKVEGTYVYSPEGENIGSIYNFMVDKQSGKVSYAVMSFGGFLGLGERYHPLPWETLTYDEGLGGYVVNVTREQLDQAPSYAQDEDPWQDPSYGRNVYGYYGTPYV